MPATPSVMNSERTGWLCAGGTHHVWESRLSAAALLDCSRVASAAPCSRRRASEAGAWYRRRGSGCPRPQRRWTRMCTFERALEARAAVRASGRPWWPSYPPPATTCSAWPLTAAIFGTRKRSCDRQCDRKRQQQRQPPAQPFRFAFALLEHALPDQARGDNQPTRRWAQQIQAHDQRRDARQQQYRRAGGQRQKPHRRSPSSRRPFEREVLEWHLGQRPRVTPAVLAAVGLELARMPLEGLTIGRQQRRRDFQFAGRCPLPHPPAPLLRAVAGRAPVDSSRAKGPHRVGTGAGPRALLRRRQRSRKSETSTTSPRVRGAAKYRRSAPNRLVRPLASCPPGN